MSKIYEKNPSITIDGDSLRQYKVMDDWELYETRIITILDSIWNNPLGKEIIQAVGGPLVFNRKLIIRPWDSFRASDPFFNPDVTTWWSRGGPWQTTEESFGENSRIERKYFSDKCVIWFSTEVYSDRSRPGSSGDELMLHEILHMFDDFYEFYIDSSDGLFKFDGLDFLTITVTNIYAASAKRPLRHDHHGFKAMRPRFAKSPDDFAIFFWKNFNQVKDRVHADFWRILSKGGSPWNPFRFHRPEDPARYRVVVKSKGWAWNFLLFKSGRAYWEDIHAKHMYGFGSWKNTGAEHFVAWASDGSWDLVPVVGGVGKTRTGGTEYETEVSMVVLGQ